MTLNARFILKALYGRMYIVAFGFDDTHRYMYSQRGRRGSGLDGLAPPLHPCGQLTRCFSAVAELLVIINHRLGGSPNLLYKPMR